MRALRGNHYRLFIVLFTMVLLFTLNSSPIFGQASSPVPTHSDNLPHPKGIQIPSTASPRPAGKATIANNVLAVSDAVYSQHYRATLVASPTLSGPYLIATDDTGNFYVSDIALNLVRKFSPAGTLLQTIGQPGLGANPGQFLGPAGIAVVGNDVFIADFNNNRIQRFNRTTGVFVSQFGSGGLLDGPLQIAYNPLNSLLYVAEYNNARVHLFNTAGVSQGTFGSRGTGLGQFENPIGVAIDPLGYVYVSDLSFNKVQKFSANGTYIRTIGSGGSSDGQFSHPIGLAVDRAGFLYVADAGNKRIQKFDWKGSFVGEYGINNASCVNRGNLVCNGFFSTPQGIAVSNIANAQPTVYVADYNTSTVQAFETSLQPTSHPFQAKWNGNLRSSGVAVDGSGNVYITDSSNNRIQKFDKYGTPLRQWGSNGNGAGEFSNPNGIAISSANNVYVTDFSNNRVQEFTSDGAFIRQWGGTGFGDGEFFGPTGIAVDDNSIYVIESVGARVQKFDLNGVFQTKWGSAGTSNGQFTSAHGIAVDNNRQFVYVADTVNDRIQIFTINGDFVSAIQTPFSGLPLTLDYPSAVATDQHGNFYVTDRNNNRIVQFNDNGQYIGTFGSFGTGDGQFDDPEAIAVDRNSGQIYTVELFTNRVQRFGSAVPKSESVGVWRPSTRTFYLRNTNTTGAADISVDTSNFSLTTDKPVVGDWNGDGVSTVGVFRNGQFLLRDSNTPGNPDYSFALGVAGDIPIVGDWNGDGKDGVGVFRPSNGLIYLKNDLTTGFADYQMVLGAPGDMGIAGDWNGDGQDSPGVRRPNSLQFFLSNKVTNGSVFADYSLQLGASTDIPFTGDWVHQGSSGVGVFRPSNGLIFLKDALTPGFADTQITLGIAGDVPVAGYWGKVPVEVVPAVSPSAANSTPSAAQPTPKLAPTFVP